MYDIIHIWLLSLPLFAMVAKSWYPWCCCDIVDPPPCSNCTADANTVSITVSGATDDYCNQCDEAFNGTFVAVRDPSVSCRWIYSNYVWPCRVVGSSFLFGARGFVLSAQTLFPSANKGWNLSLTVGANFHNDTAIYRWNSGSTSSFDCTATRSLSNYVFTPDPTQSTCANLNGLTITVN